MKKRLLSELSFDELKELHNKNKFLQDAVYDLFNSCVSDDLKEIASYLKNVTGIRYDLGNIYGDYIRVFQESYKQFLEACKELEYNLCVFPEGFSALIIDRLIAKYDFYYDCISGYEDISEKRFEKLERWFESGVENVIQQILNYVDSLQDYDSEYYLESFVEACGDEYATDGTYIYELEVKKYA